MQRARRPDGTRVAATIIAAVLGLAGCGGDGGDGDDGDDEVALPPPPEGELAELRGLRAGELTFAARPRTCTHTRAVVIGVARGPRPAKLQLGEGGCFVFANRASDASAFLRPIKSGRSVSGRRLPGVASNDLFPRQASLVYGPFDVMSRRQVRGLTGVARIRLTENERGSFAAYGPRRARPDPLRCITRATPLPPGSSPIALPYRVRPGGTQGAIVVRRGRERSPEPATQSLTALAKLDCARRTLAERPAGCDVTRAVVIVDGRPEPRELRLPAAGGCVVWGNGDRSEATLEFASGGTIEAEVALQRRRLWPRAAVAWDFFLRSPPRRISYRVKPGAMQGTIVLE